MRLRLVVSFGLLALCQCKDPPPPGPVPSATSASGSASASASVTTAATAASPSASARTHTQPYKPIARGSADVAVAGGNTDPDGGAPTSVTPASVGLPTVEVRRVFELDKALSGSRRRGWTGPAGGGILGP